MVVAIAVGTALATIASKDYKAAKTCFLLASADAIGGVTMWGAKNPSSTWLSAMLVFLACGILGLSGFFLLKYVDLKEAQEQPIGKPLYAAEVGSPFLNPGQFWAVYRSPEGEVVAPIDALIAHIVIVNLQDKPASLTAVGLEISDGNEWMQLRRIPLNQIGLFSGSLHQAGQITVDPGDLNALLVNTEIPPGRTIRGAGIYEYKDPGYRVSGTSRPRFRITIADTAKHRIQLVDTDPADHLAGTDDPFGMTEQSKLISSGYVRDLSHLPIHRFLPPSKEQDR